jgi:penicillin amidase
MKKLKKILLLVIISLLVILSIGWGFKSRLMNRALPSYQSEILIENLYDKVEVLRDTFAIPHIYAKNEDDLYRITGYITAQDRLWQMDLLRRVTMGRLSEIFGKSQIKTDMFMRMLRIPEKSLKILDIADSAIIKALVAYSDGVNQYIEENKSNLPPEFTILGYTPEKWEPQHSVNLIGYISWDLNGSWNSEILIHKLAQVLNTNQLSDLLPEYTSTEPVIYSYNKNGADWRDEMLNISDALSNLGAQVFHGSNNWAVAGWKTNTGKPLLANDMHLGFTAPGIWYLIHQVIPGKLNVTGVMLPGAPFVVSGHNDKIAWGMTNVMNDDIDFYRETLHKQDSNLYKYDGKWLPFKISNEKIFIKGGDSVNITLKFTHRGPVISQLREIPDETISMRWLGNEMSNELTSIYKLNYAGNWNEFTLAMQGFISVSQNVVYADTSGNIGLYCCAGIPVRGAGSPIDILPGDSGIYDWKGLVPFEELPYTYNPSEGYVVSANNRTIGSDYPYYISNWFDVSYRYDRIKELISGDDTLTIADFEKIQTDFKSKLAEWCVPILLKYMNTHKIEGRNKQIYEALGKWNGEMKADSYCAAFFEVFYNRFLHILIKDELGEKLIPEFFIDKILVRHTFYNVWTNEESVLCDDITTKDRIETFDSTVFKAFNEAMAYLEKNFGTDIQNWQWGKLHTIVLEHPIGKVIIMDKIFNLNRGPFEIGGSFHTVAPFTYRYNQSFDVRSGASQRHIYDLGDWDRSLSVIPTGNSGIPSSTNYCDQTELYLNGKYHGDWFSKEKVKEKCSNKTQFEVK